MPVKEETLMPFDPDPIFKGILKVMGVILGVALRIFDALLHVLSIFK